MIGCGTNGCAPMSPAQGGPDSTNAAELGRLLGPRCCRGFPMYIGVEDQQDVRGDLSQDGHDAEDWDLGTGEIDPVGCVNSVTGDLQGKSMLARRLARAALCGPFVGTPRRDCDRWRTRTARESSERAGFSSRASGGFVRSAGKAATQDPKALAEGESRSARRAARGGRKCISLCSSGRRARARHPRAVTRCSGTPSTREPAPDRVW
jgi:hypothetical protein